MHHNTYHAVRRAPNVELMVPTDAFHVHFVDKQFPNRAAARRRKGMTWVWLLEKISNREANKHRCYILSLTRNAGQCITPYGLHCTNNIPDRKYAMHGFTIKYRQCTLFLPSKYYNKFHLTVPRHNISSGVIQRQPRCPARHARTIRRFDERGSVLSSEHDSSRDWSRTHVVICPRA